MSALLGADRSPMAHEQRIVTHPDSGAPLDPQQAAALDVTISQEPDGSAAFRHSSPDLITRRAGSFAPTLVISGSGEEPGPRPTGPNEPAPLSFGRFVVLSCLGQGGMGVVYSAYATGPA